MELGATVEVKFAENTEPDNGAPAPPTATGPRTRNRKTKPKPRPGTERFRGRLSRTQGRRKDHPAIGLRACAPFTEAGAGLPAWRCDPLLLTKLLRGTALEDQVAVSDREITGLTCDSRTVTPGALFAAFRGSRTDGNRFIREALDKEPLPSSARPHRRARTAPGLVTDDPRAVFGQMAAHWFGDPGRRMTLIGVTGTNGKTTTTYLLKTILEQTLGAKVGLIGTNQNLVGHEVLPARRTTPDAYTLQALLAKMEGAGCSHVVMEVSSHALAQGRTAGLRFRTGIFTNLTRDHLDFHGNMTAYRQAKSLLFRQCDSGCFNLDDNSGRLLIRGADCRVVTFGVNQRRAEIRARGIRLEPDRVRFLVDTPRRPCR
ncbi:MAG: Mur ligase family protein [Evtepia sp.]